MIMTICRRTVVPIKLQLDFQEFRVNKFLPNQMSPKTIFVMNQPQACFIHSRMAITNFASSHPVKHRTILCCMLKRESRVSTFDFSFTLFSEIENKCKDLMIFGLQHFFFISTFFYRFSSSFSIRMLRSCVFFASRVLLGYQYISRIRRNGWLRLVPMLSKC